MAAQSAFQLSVRYVHEGVEVIQSRAIYRQRVVACCNDISIKWVLQMFRMLSTVFVIKAGGVTQDDVYCQ